MKNILKIIAFSAALFMTGNLSAQQKFGHLNSQDIFYSMPEIATIQTQLQAKSKELEGQLNVMYTQYETLVNQIQNEGATWMQAVLEAKYNELYTLEEKIVAKEEQAQQDIIALEQQLIGPVEQKAFDAITRVANTYGYTYIIDSSMGVFIVLPDGDDLTNQVKAELGIAY